MEHINQILDLKVKVMLQKIDKLCNIYTMLLQKTNSKENNSLEIIKKQYLKMYNEIIERKEYEKYKDVEDIIIKEISKQELRLDEYIYNTFQNYQEIISKEIKEIRKSGNYINFHNMDEELKKVETLTEVLKLYNSYTSKNAENEIKYEISKLKFDILYRKQVEELIYKNGSEINNLAQYSNEGEKTIFKTLLKEKVNSLLLEFINAYKDIIMPIEINKLRHSIKEKKKYDLIIEQLLSNRELLEGLIIIDMKKNPYNYINLLKAKVFNAHLCNIGNNPFERKDYLTFRQLLNLGYKGSYESYVYLNRRGEMVNKVNYSILEAILKSLITDENISFIECRNLYNKFGFECRPILMNIGQQCVKMIFNDVKNSKEVQEISQELKENKRDLKGQYCKIDFEGLVYEFTKDKKYSEDLFNQIFNKKKEEIKLTLQKPNKKFLPKRNKEEEKNLEQEKNQIVKNGFISTDINLIMSLIEKIIYNYNTEIKELEQVKVECIVDIYKKRIDMYKQNIKIEKEQLKWLESLKGKNGKFTVDEAKKLLLTVYDVYKKSNIKYDVRKILPLENMENENIRKLAPMPIAGYYKGIYEGGREYMKPLWEKYQKDFKELGINVKRYSRCYATKPCFQICVSLEDISDLPIDYEKVELLTKEEQDTILERE